MPVIATIESPRGQFRISEEIDSAASTVWWSTQGGMYFVGPNALAGQQPTEEERQAAVAVIRGQIEADDADV